MKFHTTVRSLTLASALGLAGPLAHAGAAAGSIVYAPAASGIPTLSEWTLLALAALVALISYRHLRQKFNGQPLAALFLTLALGAATLVTGHFGNQALAVVFAPVSLSLPNGGTITFNCGSSTVTNNTSVTMKIISVTSTPTPTGTCTNLPTMPPADTCTVVRSCPV